MNNDKINITKQIDISHDDEFDLQSKAGQFLCELAIKQYTTESIKDHVFTLKTPFGIVYISLQHPPLTGKVGTNLSIEDIHKDFDKDNNTPNTGTSK